MFKTPSGARDVSRKGNSLGTQRVPCHTPSPREVNGIATAQINFLVCYHSDVLSAAYSIRAFAAFFKTKPKKVFFFRVRSCIMRVLYIIYGKKMHEKSEGEPCVSFR